MLDPIPHQDRWLSPRRQTEYPAWDLVAEDKLHGRREATFLVLAASFLVTTAVVVVLGTSRTVDPAPVLAAALPDLALPIAMQIPFGVVPFALGVVALALVCELYGRRRAAALVATGLVATGALVGLLWLADRLDGRGTSFGPALGFGSCVLVGSVTHVAVFDALRRRAAGRHLWLRLLVSSVLAQLMGWAAFGVVMDRYAALAGSSEPDAATIRALAAGSALYTLAGVVVLTPLISLIARGLRLFLRVARHDADGDGDGRDELDAPLVELAHRRPSATEGSVATDAIIAGAGAPDAAAVRRRAVRSSIPPYSSAEMRFFTEGDQLAESGTEP